MRKANSALAAQASRLGSTARRKSGPVSARMTLAARPCTGGQDFALSRGVGNPIGSPSLSDRASSCATPPPPTAGFDASHGFHRTAAPKGALEPDLFPAIAAGATTADDLAARCQASPRGVRILADYLTVIGFLAKPDGHYRLSPVAAA